MAVNQRILKQHDGSTLIEWVDGETGIKNRGWFPAKSVKDGEATNLDHAIPYGDTLEEGFKKALPKPADIVNLLHKNDIWTFEEAATNANLVLNIFAQAYGDAITALLRKFQEDKQNANS